MDSLVLRLHPKIFVWGLGTGLSRGVCTDVHIDPGGDKFTRPSILQATKSYGGPRNKDTVLQAMKSCGGPRNKATMLQAMKSYGGPRNKDTVLQAMKSCTGPRNKATILRPTKSCAGPRNKATILQATKSCAGPGNKATVWSLPMGQNSVGVPVVLIWETNITSTSSFGRSLVHLRE